MFATWSQPITQLASAWNPRRKVCLATSWRPGYNVFRRTVYPNVRCHYPEAYNTDTCSCVSEFSTAVLWRLPSCLLTGTAVTLGTVLDWEIFMTNNDVFQLKSISWHKMKRNRSLNTTNGLLAKMESSYVTTCFGLFLWPSSGYNLVALRVYTIQWYLG